MVAGWQVVLDESQPQGEPQVVEHTQEGQQAKEIEQAPQPQLRRSGRTRALVTPRADT